MSPGCKATTLSYSCEPLLALEYKYLWREELTLERAAAVYDLFKVLSNLKSALGEPN